MNAAAQIHSNICARTQRNKPLVHMVLSLFVLRAIVSVFLFFFKLNSPVQCTTRAKRAALLASIYFRPVDVIGRPIANKERINGASLKAAGSLLPGHSLITVSLTFALIEENKRVK